MLSIIVILFTKYAHRVVEYGKEYTFDVSYKSMYVTGIYELDGQILVLPITGSGKFSAQFCKELLRK